MLVLSRPLVFLDFETTGNNVKEDQIIQYCFKKIKPDNSSEKLTGLIKPGIPIKETAINIHGISNSQVDGCPSFKDIAVNIYDFIFGCDLAGFNSNSFDIPILYNEFIRVGIDWDYTKSFFIDTCSIYKINEPRDLKSAYKHYLGRDLQSSHDAEGDVDATIAIWMIQSLKYEHLPSEISELAVYCNYQQQRADLSGCFLIKDGEYVINIGKHKGNKAKDHPDFLSWMMSKDFPPDVKRICNNILSPQGQLF